VSAGADGGIRGETETILTRTQALALLDRYSKPSESWPLHCRQVAKVARTLAEALAVRGALVNPDLAEAQALLHDVGRSLTHGPLHGWTGFVLVRSHGHAREARGCLTHWLKGREPHELLRGGRLKEGFVQRTYRQFEDAPWSLQDSVMSLADSCVANTTIVTLAERHADLVVRYGASAWLRRAEELAERHAEEISAALGFRAEDLLVPLHGDRLDPR
jgi:putative nucleotidyltransferase with HDIG domain